MTPTNDPLWKAATQHAPWLATALLELGVSERWNPQRIEQYHAATRAGRAPVTVPWCASFACWVLLQHGILSPRSKAAQDFETWGQLGELEPGNLAVYRRGEDAEHVHFVLYASGQWIWGVGGNQQNAVTVARYPFGSLKAVRRPAVP